MFLRGTVSYAQAQGPRKAQEDYLVHVPFTDRRGNRGHLLGVMDGHGGGETARYCAETIPALFNHDTENVERELRDLVAALDARTRLAGPGSTLSLACVNESRNSVTTAVLGDSPIIVVDDNGTVHRSVEHNVRTNLLERSAAIMRGAVYKGGYIQVTEDGDGLQVSRALGDRTLSAILDRTPSIRTFDIGSHSLVIVGSDGLLDPEHGSQNDRVLHAILATARRADAIAVLHLREEQGLEDNTSVIMWKPRRWWNLFS